MKCDAKAGRTMSDSRAVPKNSLETLNRLREATRRVCVMMPPPSAPLPMDTAANQKVAFEALNLHAANLKFLRHCRVVYGYNPYTDSVFRAIEQWARLAPAEKAKDWMPWASYLVDSREHDGTGFNADFLSWGGQLDDWIGQCAGEGADPAAAIAKARSRAPGAGKERGLPVRQSFYHWNRGKIWKVIRKVILIFVAAFAAAIAAAIINEVVKVLVN